MNTIDSYREGANSVAKPAAEKLNEMGTVLENTAEETKEAISGLVNTTASGFEELNYRNLKLSKFDTFKDLSEDSDISAVLCLIDKYCAEKNFQKTQEVAAFLKSLHAVERNLTTNNGIEYSAIDDTEETKECSLLLFMAVVICNELSKEKFNEEAYDQILNNISIKQSERNNIPIIVKEKIELYSPQKWAYLLTGYDMYTEFEQLRREIDTLKEQNKREHEDRMKEIEDEKIAQQGREKTIQAREERIEKNSRKQTLTLKIQEAIDEFIKKENENAPGMILDENNISEKLKPYLSKGIARGQVAPEEIRAFYTGNIITNFCISTDIKAGKLCGLLITDLEFCYKEANMGARNQYMSYKNMQSVKNGAINIVIKGKDSSKMRIRKHMLFDNNILVGFINQIIAIENKYQ